MIRLSGAPVSFGVDEVQAEAHRPSPETILREVASLGLTGIELGPPGFLGDPDGTQRRLTDAGLELVGAYFPLRLSRREHIEADLQALDAWLEDLRRRTPAGSRPVAILADDFFEPDRLALAVVADDHPECWLTPDRLDLLVANLHRAAERCRRAGFDVVVHPHLGTYIETEAEVRHVAEHLDPSLAALCLDTGHVRAGGGDPAAVARDYPGLIRHVHLKDVDPVARDEVRRAVPGLKGAIEGGIFCELGRGDAGIAEVLAALDDAGYDGWIVLEQDRKVLPGDALADLTASVARNAAFVRDRIGVASH